MKTNNSTLERYNPAKEDKKKAAKFKRPQGKTITFAPGCSVIVPHDATQDEIDEHVNRAMNQLAKSKNIEINAIYKNYKGNAE